MLKNYLKIAIRSLLKQKAYSFINIIGLSVGIASCLLIVLFVTDEFSYDKFHDKADRLYKVALERKYPNHSTFYALIPHSYAGVMQRDFPEVEAVVLMGGPFNGAVVNYEKPDGTLVQFEEDFMMAADSNFFEVFSIDILKGNAEKPLSELSDVVINERTARRYFGDDEPVGKVLQFFGQDFKVTAVCENLPDNSHMKFDFITKWDDQFFGGRRENFITFTAHVYLLLKPGTDAAALEAKFPKMVDTYAAAQIEADLGKSWEDYRKEGNGYRYFLQPITSIHLDPTNIEAKMKPGGNIRYVYFLISVAVLIVIIACINFMNLATARSSERAREVGVRKTMGSEKKQLVYQFLIESILLSVLATVIALVLVQFALPYFNGLAGKQLVLGFSAPVLSLLLLLAVVVGLLAGSYPAFFLSGFNPVVVMKGTFTGSSKGAWLRNGLVVFQFWISIVLIVGTLVVSDQMKYMQNKSLGYNKDQVLVVERAFALQDKAQTFIEEVRRIPGVQAAAGSFALLGRQGDFFGAQFQPEGSSEVLTTKTMVIDDDFAPTIGFEFIEGKGFSRETNDSLSIILNESAARTLDLGSNPVGQKLTQVQRGPDGTNLVVYTIIGVIRDFNFQSLRDEITPLTILSNESFGGGTVYVYARVNPKEVNDVIAQVETRWKEVSPAEQPQPFKYLFLDENLKANYESEKRVGTLFAVFSSLAIIIACVGLFGLAAYTASLRTKEIGVRKVLGASVVSVIFLLSKDFTKLVLAAFVLAVPLGWYLMDNWLEGFAYRTTLSIGTFLLAGGLALLISWITVSYQSIKAAVRNPVNALRSE